MMMIKFSSRAVWLSLSLLPAGLLSASAATAGQESMPQFSFAYYTWSKTENAFQPIPGAGPGPVLQDPAHPVHGHPIRIADLDNPILKPWVIEKMREQNELALAGKEAYEAHAACHPTGVPGFLVSGALNPMYILQGPREVVLINEGFAEVRHIFLNVPHSAHLKPTPYGESVGHYQGDQLVVDTIGLSDDTYIDNYRTPHTTQLHVVERFKLVDDGKMLQVDVRVDDPGSIQYAMVGAANLSQGHIGRFLPREGLEGQMLEAPCEQNSQIKDATYSPAPIADKSDF